jgi:hypothetical protein
VEQRRAPRYKTHVPVIFEWLDKSGTIRLDGGFTRDISRQGIFVWCEGECRPCRREIMIALLFQGIAAHPKPWRMRSTGRVLRVHDAPENKGFAVTLQNLGVVILDLPPRGQSI